jgi:hypothetical protein
MFLFGVDEIISKKVVFLKQKVKLPCYTFKGSKVIIKFVRRSVSMETKFVFDIRNQTLLQRLQQMKLKSNTVNPVLVTIAVVQILQTQL